MKKLKEPTSWRLHFGQWPYVAVSLTDMDASDNKVQFILKWSVFLYGAVARGRRRGITLVYAVEAQHRTVNVIIKNISHYYLIVIITSWEV